MVLFIMLLVVHSISMAQCAMCTKTAAGLNDDSARGLNGGIIYLALMPLTLISILAYKWWQSNKETI